MRTQRLHVEAEAYRAQTDTLPASVIKQRVLATVCTYMVPARVDEYAT